MIYSRTDGTFIITKNDFPYHVIESDLENWEDVQTRITAGEEVKEEKPIQPNQDMEWNEITEEWEYITVFLIDPDKLSKGFLRIENESIKRINEGFTHAANKFPADPAAQALLNKYYIENLLGDQIFPFFWITKDNVKIEITDMTLLDGLKTKMYNHINLHREAAFQVKENILNSSTKAEARDYYNNYFII